MPCFHWIIRFELKSYLDLFILGPFSHWYFQCLGTSFCYFQKQWHRFLCSKRTPMKTTILYLINVMNVVSIPLHFQDILFKICASGVRMAGGHITFSKNVTFYMWNNKKPTVWSIDQFAGIFKLAQIQACSFCAYLFTLHLGFLKFDQERSPVQHLCSPPSDQHVFHCQRSFAPAPCKTAAVCYSRRNASNESFNFNKFINVIVLMSQINGLRHVIFIIL